MKYEQPADKKKQGVQMEFERWKRDLEERAGKATAGQSESIVAKDEETQKIYAELENRINQVAKPGRLGEGAWESILEEAIRVRPELGRDGWKLLDAITNAALVKEAEYNSSYDYKIMNMGKVFLIFGRPKQGKAKGPASVAVGQESRGTGPEIEEGGIQAMRHLIGNGYERTAIFENQPDRVKPEARVIKSTDDGRYHVFEPKNG